MWYGRFKAGAYVLLLVLCALLFQGISMEFEPKPVMSMGINDGGESIDALTRSVGSINSIEYKQTIKTIALGNKISLIDMHYYYVNPGYLRVETSSSGSLNIDIYTPGGMYEYFPQSGAAYFREKWNDGKPVTFQLQDKLEDMTVEGKYRLFKTENAGGVDAQIIRSVDEDKGEIYEHRVWLADVEGLKLPIKEEYLSDGEVNSSIDYEYISVNKYLSPSVFQLNDSEKLKIYSIDGMPKQVADEKEAEKYVKFDIVIPKFVPKGFSIKEIHIFPPIKTPSVIIYYGSDSDTINYTQKNIKADELAVVEGDKTISAGGKKYAIRKSGSDYVEVRWISKGIEYEISGPYGLKEEIIKLVQSISGVWISI